MKERPIIFSAPMVRAILEGKKTQTRRVLKPQPAAGQMAADYRTAIIDWQIQGRDGLPVSSHRLPYAPGDRLWVREMWRYAREPHCRCPQASMADPCDRWKAGEGCESVKGKVLCRADGEIATGRWRPSIHMPRWASRITLEVTGVKVERLQDISEADARAEGAPEPFACDHTRRSCADIGCLGPTYRAEFCDIWNTINGPGAWDQNPWVAAYTFKVLDTKGVWQ